MDSEQLVCQRDGVPTRLRCAKCEVGICPACMVRTPVGHKCPSCAGESTEHRRRSPRVLVLGGAAFAAALAGVLLLRPPSGTTTDPVSLQTAETDVAPTRQAMIGEEARDGQLTFVVEDFACGPEGVVAEAVAPSVQGKLCQLRITVTNTSGSPTMFLGRFQYLLDGQSRTHGPDEGLSRAAPENANRSLWELNINPGSAVPIVLIYDIPGPVEPREAQLKGNGRSRFGINVRLQRRAG